MREKLITPYLMYLASLMANLPDLDTLTNSVTTVACPLLLRRAHDALLMREHLFWLQELLTVRPWLRAPQASSAPANLSVLDTLTNSVPCCSVVHMAHS